MVVVREAVSDEDLEAWRRVFMVVVPNERAVSVAEMRGTARKDLLRLLAEEDGAVVGSGIAGPSDFPDAGWVAPRVLPTARRRGVGTELLRVLARHVESIGVSVVNAHVDDAGSLAFAERFGFREIDRQVEQVRVIGDEPVPRTPDGVEIVSVRDRPEVWRQAYDVAGAAGVRGHGSRSRRSMPPSTSGRRTGSQHQRRCSSRSRAMRWLAARA